MKKEKKSKLKINYRCLKFDLRRLNLCEKISYKTNLLPAINIEKKLVSINKKNNEKVGILSLVLSFLAGVINGLFGGGAGMLIVPILEEIMKLKTKTSHATAVLIVLPLCVFSVIAYALTNKFDFTNGLWVVVGVVLGGIVGAVLLKKLDAKIIRFIFAFLVIFAGGKLLIDTLGDIF